MPTPLTISICLALTLAITAGAFYWGKFIGITLKTSTDNQTRINLATKQIEEMAEAIEQLNYQLDNDKREKVGYQPQKQGWDPSNPLSSERR